MAWLRSPDQDFDIRRFRDRLDRLAGEPMDKLTHMSDDAFERDLTALWELACYCLRDDTGGLISRELARVFIPDGSRLYRLYAAGFLHDPYDLRTGRCDCGVRTALGCFSVHRPVLDAAAW